MTLVAGRLPTLQRRSYAEENNMQGILKSGPTRRTNVPSTTYRRVESNQRSEDGKRLVRFCETRENERQDDGCESEISEQDNQDVIMMGNTMYYVNNSDPNSAVSKLFPNSKLTPINPFRSSFKDITKNKPLTKTFESNRNTINCARSNNIGVVSPIRRTVERNVPKRNFLKVPPETKAKPGKANLPPTPLIERIKQLTLDSANTDEWNKDGHEEVKSNTLKGRSDFEPNRTNNPNIKEQNNFCQHGQNVKDLPKQAKDGLNLMRYNQIISQTRSQLDKNEKPLSLTKANITDEARRSFLSSLAQGNEGESGDRSSVATNSTNADTVYSLSDIEEVLTEEEEKEIRDAFAKEIKQDELELFVQQDAGRTERLRKRYSSTPKPEDSMSKLFSNTHYSSKSINPNIQHYPNGFTIKKDKPKFGSTIEILQQLQQQIETPYQLEGRRTACSNYSDCSIPISDRLFFDESSDGYEPVNPKLIVHRTCSLDSKNYEEIENFPSAFSVPRTKSHEHPRLTHLDSDPYFYPTTSMRYPPSFSGRSQVVDHSVYASSPNLHGYHNSILPDRFAAYKNLPANRQQLHPVLQKQYCRYPAHEMPPSPAEEGKVLTPPSRMHTYMNIPTSAPCYPSPPPYSKINHCPNPPDIYHFENPHVHTNIYQNVPPPSQHMMTIRRLCTENERGVPEGASTTSDSKEMYSSSPLKDVYSRSNMTTIPKPTSLPHHYCVHV